MKINIKKAFIVIATLIGTMASGLAIYEWLTSRNDILIEQRIDPEVLEKYRHGDTTITIEKGIRIERDRNQ